MRICLSFCLSLSINIFHLLLSQPKKTHSMNITFKYTRVLLSVSVSVQRSGLCGPGPHYQHSVPITMYVRINVVPTVNQTRGGGLVILTVPITRP